MSRAPAALVLGSLLALTSAATFGQSELQLRVRQLPGWDARAREGKCEIRIWVDNRAEVRMRGDTIFVRTLEGSRGRDEGSACNQALPYNSVRSFEIHQTAGRSRIALAQQPSRMNNFTALIAIEDTQGGGDNYAFDATWLSEAGDDSVNAAAPFYDDVRACQESVRQTFRTRNGRSSYIDFHNFADRLGGWDSQVQEPDPNGQGNSRSQAAFRRTNPNGSETIRGKGSARGQNESRDVSWSCAVDPSTNRILSANYRFAGAGVRTNDRAGDRGQLR